VGKIATDFHRLKNPSFKFQGTKETGSGLEKSVFLFINPTHATTPSIPLVLHNLS